MILSCPTNREVSNKMCVALAVPPGQHVPESRLNACFQHNPDGAGFGYYNSEGEQIIKKGYKTFKEFITAYHEHRDVNTDRPFLVHFRIRTHGDKGEANCHPFALDNGMLIHNGMIDGLGDDGYGDGAKSDTAEFAELIKKTPVDKFNVLCAKLDESDILGWSTVIMLTKENDLEFVGSGEWIDGVFFSNTFWRTTESRLAARTATEDYSNMSNEEWFRKHGFGGD
jgi:predicted glutamine amidotransferase